MEYVNGCDMEFCFFRVIYKDGSELAQYEDTNQGFIRHHWPEVDLDRVKTIEAWVPCMKDGILFLDCVHSVDIKRGMEPYFRYRNTRHMHINLRSRKAIIGYRKKSDPEKQQIWEIDKYRNVRLRVEMTK